MNSYRYLIPDTAGHRISIVASEMPVAVVTTTLILIDRPYKSRFHHKPPTIHTEPLLRTLFTSYQSINQIDRSLKQLKLEYPSWQSNLLHVLLLRPNTMDSQLPYCWPCPSCAATTHFIRQNTHSHNWPAEASKLPNKRIVNLNIWLFDYQSD